jgi:methyl-accepting chemotaxis protein
MRRRQKYLIDKQYQLRFVLGGVIYIAAIAVCLSLPFIPLIRSMNALLVDFPADVGNMVRKQQTWVMMTFVLCSVWLLAAWVIFAIMRTHKVAGPMFNIVQTMKKIASGSLNTRIKLRTGDDLQLVATGINDMLDALREREESAKQRIREFLATEPSTQGSSTDRAERAIASAFPLIEPAEDELTDEEDTTAELVEIPS